MPCYSPLHGYRSALVTANGKRKISFSRSSGFSDLAMTVPCGQCIGCRIDRSRHWALRCVHESKAHVHNSFITLTYDDDHIPLRGSLDKSHLQKFFKRLRKKYGSFRYFASGEYGDYSDRPHYHVIIFGLDFLDDRYKHSTTGRGDVLYVSPSVTKIWGKGHVVISQFTYQTAAYTARYVVKKVTGKMSSEHYSRVCPFTGEIYQLVPEFALMSLRPGIGASWYNRFRDDVFPSDFLVHEGKKHPVPRYYTNKLKNEDVTTFKAINLKRKMALKNDVNSTPDRLYVREEVKKSKLNTLSRSL